MSKTKPQNWWEEDEPVRPSAKTTNWWEDDEPAAPRSVAPSQPMTNTATALGIVKPGVQAGIAQKPLPPAMLARPQAPAMASASDPNNGIDPLAPKKGEEWRKVDRSQPKTQPPGTIPMVTYDGAGNEHTVYIPDPRIPMRAEANIRAANKEYQDYRNSRGDTINGISDAIIGKLKEGDKAIASVGNAALNVVDPNRNASRFISENITPLAEKAGQGLGSMISGVDPNRQGLADLGGAVGGAVSEWGATTARDPVQGLGEATNALEPTHWVAEGYNDLRDALGAAFQEDWAKFNAKMGEANPKILGGTAGMLPGGSFTVDALRNLGKGGAPSLASQIFKPGPTAVDRAADILIKKMNADGLTLDDLRKVQGALARRGDSGVYETLSEVAGLSDKSSGANLRGLAMALGAVPGPAQEALIARVAENADKLSSRVTRAATRATGQSADNAVATLDQLDARLKQESGPLYDTAYAAQMDPNVYSAQIAPMLSEDLGQDAAKAALRGLRTKLSGLRIKAASPGNADPARTAFELQRMGQSASALESFLKGENTQLPVQALDEIKRAFDDQISTSGRYTAGNIRAAKNNFSEAVSNATGGAYGNALGTYEGISRLQEAFDFGVNSLNKKTWELQREMSQGLMGRKWSGGEVEAIAMGVARAIEDAIEAGDNAALTRLTKGKALKNIATALDDPQAAAMFEESMNRLAANREWGRRVAGGSDTAMRQAAIKDATTLEEDPVTRALDRAKNSTAPPTVTGAIWSAVGKPVVEKTQDAYRRLKYPGIYDEEVNKALAPLMSRAMTKGGLDEVAAAIEQRLAANGRKALPPPPSNGPKGGGSGGPPKISGPKMAALSSPKPPPVKAGFFGSGSKPLDMSEAGRSKTLLQQLARPNEPKRISELLAGSPVSVTPDEAKEMLDLIRMHLRPVDPNDYGRGFGFTLDELKADPSIAEEFLNYDPQKLAQFQAVLGTIGHPSQSGSSKLLAGMGGEGAGAVAGGIIGAMTPPTDSNGDGVIDEIERAAARFNAITGAISGGLIVKGGKLVGNSLRGEGKAAKQARLINELDVNPDTTPGLSVEEAEALRRVQSGRSQPRPPPAQMTFGGIGAKTADKKLLGIAQDMEKAGAGRDQIWRETGWFKGVDGKWRFEIDDSGSKLLPAIDYSNTSGWTAHKNDDRWIVRDQHGRAVGNTRTSLDRTPEEAIETVAYNFRRIGTSSRLDSVLDHPELYNAYPSLREVEARVGAGQAEDGSHLAVDDAPWAERITASARDDAGVRSVLLHEAAGHGVQSREGFAKGGSPDGAFEQDAALAGRAKAIAEADQRFEAALIEKPYLEPLARRLQKATRTNNKFGQTRVMRELELTPGGDEIIRLWNDVRLYAGQRAPSSTSIYKNLAGEVEARNVQTRRDMSPAERKANPPWKTQDVPDEQQIVKFDSGVQQSTGPWGPRGSGKGPPKPANDTLPKGQKTPAEDLAMAREFNKEPLTPERAYDFWVLLKDEKDLNKVIDVLDINLNPSILSLPRGRAMVERTREEVLRRVTTYLRKETEVNKASTLSRANAKFEENNRSIANEITQLREQGVPDQMIARSLGLEDGSLEYFLRWSEPKPPSGSTPIRPASTGEGQSIEIANVNGNKFTGTLYNDPAEGISFHPNYPSEVWNELGDTIAKKAGKVPSNLKRMITPEGPGIMRMSVKKTEGPNWSESNINQISKDAAPQIDEAIRNRFVGIVKSNPGARKYVLETHPDFTSKDTRKAIRSLARDTDHVLVEYPDDAIALVSRPVFNERPGYYIQGGKVSYADPSSPPPRQAGFFSGGKGLTDTVADAYGGIKRGLFPNDPRHLNPAAEALQAMDPKAQALVMRNASQTAPRSVIEAAETPPQLAELVGRAVSQNAGGADKPIDAAAKSYQTRLAELIMEGQRNEADLINMDRKAGPIGALEKGVKQSYDWTPGREAQQEALLSAILGEGEKGIGGIPERAGGLDRFREGIMRGAAQDPLMISPRDENKIAQLIFDPGSASEAARLMNAPVKPWVSDLERKAIQLGVPATGLAAMIAAGTSLYNQPGGQAGQEGQPPKPAPGSGPDQPIYTVPDRMVGTSNPAEPPPELNGFNRDTRVRAQQRLMALGYAPQKLKPGVRFDDGVDGEATRAAVMRFQRENDLPVTGDLDPMTLRALWGGRNFMNQPTMRAYGEELAPAPR